MRTLLFAAFLIGSLQASAQNQPSEKLREYKCIVEFEGMPWVGFKVIAESKEDAASKLMSIDFKEIIPQKKVRAECDPLVDPRL